MNYKQSQLPAWVNPCVIGGAVSLLAAYLGFWDYIQPSESDDLCIDTEEGATDLEIAGLALIGGLVTLYGHFKHSVTRK
ncbi:MAG: hypothetical protein USCGTAYLOR_02909 [Chromatiales bacterium USCg_Taylor]|nr:MAG: hypothetical protein USCGTAYLOR_02909 [Chromatiales bacterium USCg_Taylor]